MRLLRRSFWTRRRRRRRRRRKKKRREQRKREKKSHGASGPFPEIEDVAGVFGAVIGSASVTRHEAFLRLGRQCQRAQESKRSCT